MKYKRYSLFTIIKRDCLIHGKIHLILLIIIMLSANFIVVIVYKTRLLITQEENLILKKKNSEWRELMIEKNMLSVHSKKK